MIRLAWCCALLFCAVSASAMSLSDLSPGKTVCGPKLTVDEMKGKVVLVMFWGTR